MRRVPLLAPVVMTAIVALGLAVAGCGVPLIGAHASAPHGQAAPPPEARIRSTVTRAQRTHEIPTPAPGRQALGGWRSPGQAGQGVAAFDLNPAAWTADTAATHMHILAQAAIGQARSAMTLAAAQVAHDSSLKLGGIANSGTVE